MSDPYLLPLIKGCAPVPLAPMERRVLMWDNGRMDRRNVVVRVSLTVAEHRARDGAEWGLHTLCNMTHTTSRPSAC